ncbi:MAG: site-specific DNA-methyltransferase [Gammaproteobacteria bacterium]|nr:site-specific DNA-methyltransferase [Gammaproteobacteria bacterium]
MPTRKKAGGKKSAAYRHTDARAALRPEVGAQRAFQRQGARKAAAQYRYDSSLAPVLNWDENAARAKGEKHIAAIQQAAAQLAKLRPAGGGKDAGKRRADAEKTIADAADALAKMGAPFLEWAGKAEGREFSVPTLPLFTHERLSTQAVLETLQGHKREPERNLDLFHESDLSITEKTLKAYQHQNGWTNRLILGDSLRVMNSLLRYENLGREVQCVYMDPPYGIKFGSNFQPFVRRREVKHGSDESMAREPEMVQAYRDTWQLGVHSYLSYLRDRLYLARELLADSGSCFVQISDENVHLVRCVMDEVFGKENFVSQITYKTSSGMSKAKSLKRTADFLVWYAKDSTQMKFNRLFRSMKIDTSIFSKVEDADGIRRPMTAQEKKDPSSLPSGTRAFTTLPLHSKSGNDRAPRKFEGKQWNIPSNRSWSYSLDSFNRLVKANRIISEKTALRAIYYYNDLGYAEYTNNWTDTGPELSKNYVVQTNSEVIQRCILLTTDPGDLVFDPTCGSGTTAFVAEQWGRRWVTCDTSRVPLALARQRLLTATYPYYRLKDRQRGPAGGFVYERKQNRAGVEVGGIVPHITLKSIANDEPPAEEVLVDKPSPDNSITRITGAFCFEAIIPTPADAQTAQDAEEHGDYIKRMVEVLRLSARVNVGGKPVELRDVRAPAKSFALHAEARLEGGEVAAFVFGPENGAVIDALVAEAAEESRAKKYRRLFVVGFAIEPKARTTINDCETVYEIPADYVQAAPDLNMGDLLKTQRSSQIFAVCGRPDVALAGAGEKDGEALYEAQLRGLDVFDPVTMKTESRKGDDVPMWLLDTDYDGQCFRVSQAFFPRTSAWENIKRALKTEFDDSVWEHLRGATSAPFAKGRHARIAVKVIDDRGNELVVEKKFDEA